MNKEMNKERSGRSIMNEYVTLSPRKMKTKVLKSEKNLRQFCRKYIESLPSLSLEGTIAEILSFTNEDWN